MGTYTTIVCQKKNGSEWVVVLPVGHGYNPEIPHSYGKMDMMQDIDISLGVDVSERGRLHIRRQDFQSPESYHEPGEYAPWAKRGFPIDIDDKIKEIFDEDYIDSVSWVMLDELLGYDFDEEYVTTYFGQKLTWNEYLLPAYRIWFERLKEIGVERIIYGND